MSYLRHVQWLRRAGGPSLKTLEPELGALQARLDRLLRRLQLLVCFDSRTLYVPSETFDPKKQCPAILILNTSGSPTDFENPALRPHMIPENETLRSQDPHKSFRATLN